MSGFSDFIYKKKGIYGVLHIIILLLSIYLIVDISFDIYNNIGYLEQTKYLQHQFWICIFFILVFVLEFFLSKEKWYYFRTHFIFLLVCIPYTNIIDYFGVSLSNEAHYFIRFIPLIRSGYALAIVVGWLTSSKASGLFISYTTMLLATVYFASLLFFVVEHKINPEVKNYEDSLWWAFMNVTTVGSNIYAITPTGRILSVLLSACGMMMFPIFTVYVTSVVQNANQRKKEYYKKEQEDKLKEEAKKESKAAAQTAQTSADTQTGTKQDAAKQTVGSQINKTASTKEAAAAKSDNSDTSADSGSDTGSGSDSDSNSDSDSDNDQTSLI